jgi:hypothetical protein
MAQKELSQLEARFIARIERSRDKSGATLVDFDSRLLNRANVISTPAIDAMIFQGQGM